MRDLCVELSLSSVRITTESNRRMQEWLDKLSTTKVSANRFTAVRDGVFGERADDSAPKRLRAIDNFTNIHTAEVERVGATGYALVNTITGYADHMLSYNGDDTQRAESRMLSVIEGASEKFKERAMGVFATVEPKAVLTFAK